MQTRGKVRRPAWQRWQPGRPAVDVPHTNGSATATSARTLEIRLEEAGSRSRVLGVLTTLGAQHGTGLYRFVARAPGEDDAQPTLEISSGTFTAQRTPLDALPPQEDWAPGMTRQLADLRDRLADDGWVAVGQGRHPWSYRYVRRLRRPGVQADGNPS